MQPAIAQIIPGVTTPVWTYNGSYPGPTIKARKGRQVVIRQQNSLSEAMTVHLHGGYVDGDSDGHPNDLIAPAGTRTTSTPTTRTRGPCGTTTTR